jgi:hypothetical protein
MSIDPQRHGATPRVDPHLVFGISLVIALVLSWPSLSGAMHGLVDIVQAAIHLLVAMAISWAGCYGVGSLLHGYAQSTPAPSATAVAPTDMALDDGANPQRRATDVVTGAIETAGAIGANTDEFEAA